MENFVGITFLNANTRISCFVLSVLYIAWASLLLQTLGRECSIENDLHSNFLPRLSASFNLQVFEAVWSERVKYCRSRCAITGQYVRTGNEMVLLNLGPRFLPGKSEIINDKLPSGLPLTLSMLQTFTCKIHAQNVATTSTCSFLSCFVSETARWDMWIPIEYTCQMLPNNVILSRIGPV